MSDERLSFSDSAPPYHALHFTEHFNRYALVAEACKGKDVLDIACGEGYGSRLLKMWGARSVVGIDVSQDAINSAIKNFGMDGITYLCADAAAAPSMLSGRKFDLIVSFETIEHLESPDDFLRGLRQLRQENGTLVLSCPNDYAHEWINNPYHLRKYRFHEFQNETEKVLGRAKEWLIGTPIVGHTHIPLEKMPSPGNSPHDILEGQREDISSWSLPTQRNIHPELSSCSYYVGRWGSAALTRSLAFSPQSLRGSAELWELYQQTLKCVEDLRLENRRLRESTLENLPVKYLAMPAVAGRWSKRKQKWVRSFRKRLGLPISGY